jgi:hypothetical protein
MGPEEHGERSNGDATVSPIEELRERLRPRAIDDSAQLGVTVGERLALERVQALELQVATTHRRERELLELAVKDGNRIASLRTELDRLRDLAARAEQAERAVFEADTRAEGADRRAELMESELMSTRAEVDRLRTRIVELEASLRRALAEVGEAASRRAEPRSLEGTRGDQPAERSLELADELRMKVVDLESSLRAVMSGVSEGETTAAITDRTTEEDLAAEIERAAEMAGASATAAAQVRLAELEERLSALDERIAFLGGSTASDEPAAADVADAEPADAELAAAEPAAAEPEMADEDHDQEDDLFVDLSSDEPQVIEELSPGEIKPPASRWSDWRTT